MFNVCWCVTVCDSPFLKIHLTPHSALCFFSVPLEVCDVFSDLFERSTAMPLPAQKDAGWKDLKIEIDIAIGNTFTVC